MSKNYFFVFITTSWRRRWNWWKWIHVSSKEMQCTWWKVPCGSSEGTGRDEWAAPSPPQPGVVLLVWSAVTRRRLRPWRPSPEGADVVISEHLHSTRSCVATTAVATFLRGISKYTEEGCAWKTDSC
jgi:hypothetical protein